MLNLHKCNRKVHDTLEFTNTDTLSLLQTSMPINMKHIQKLCSDEQRCLVNLFSLLPFLLKHKFDTRL